MLCVYRFNHNVDNRGVQAPVTEAQIKWVVDIYRRLLN